MRSYGRPKDWAIGFGTDHQEGNEEMTRNLCVFVLVALINSATFAAITPGTWTTSTATTAQGSVGDINITASTNDGAPFAGPHHGRFASVGLCVGWDGPAAYELPESALALTTTTVNAGDVQTFDFDAPWMNGYFYIENFDAGSLATITVTGGEIEFLGASPSISYAGTTVSSGVLSTTNNTPNGEGDVVFAITGGATSISIAYDGGGAGNGVFYGFAEPMAMPAAVPEPTSVMVWCGLIAAVFGLQWKRRTNAG